MTDECGEYDGVSTFFCQKMPFLSGQKAVCDHRKSRFWLQKSHLGKALRHLTDHCVHHFAHMQLSRFLMPPFISMFIVCRMHAKG
jgi:hypothetical protein